MWTRVQDEHNEYTKRARQRRTYAAQATQDTVYNISWKKLEAYTGANHVCTRVHVARLRIAHLPRVYNIQE